MAETTHYFSNQEFLQLLIEYKKTQSKKVYNEIGKLFISISTNLLNKTSFINYSQDRKDEMISDAVYSMCRYIDKYDISRDNPFAYFTRFAFNAFMNNINNYKKLNERFRNVSFIDNFEKIDDFVE
ncbi:MAG: hypothetical protein WC260_01765 [Candidatus Pacearchaeota archaeon]